MSEETKRKKHRSARLKKYEAVYLEYVRKTGEKPRKESKKEPPKETPKEPLRTSKERKPLNAYQEFVKEESKKEKYQKLKAKERMAIIAKEWDRKKRKVRKDKRNLKGLKIR